MDRQPAVAVVGSINIDLIARVPHLPRAGETVLGETISRGLGGKGANQAAAVAAVLGCCTMIGAVGDDADGSWALGQLAARGIDVSRVSVIRDEPTGAALISVDTSGENSIVIIPGANTRVYPHGSSVSPETDAVITQLEIPLDTVERLAADYQGFLAVNPSPARELPRSILERTDLFVVNEEEYRAMPELAKARTVVVTLGSRGVRYLEHGREAFFIEAARPRRVVNSVGAGDAFLATMVSALVSGAAPRTAVCAGAVAGAMAVESDSAQPNLPLLEQLHTMPSQDDSAGASA